MRILLLEDDARYGDLVRDRLIDAGYIVDLVRSASAFQSVASLGTYDLIILDLGLPDGDGLDLIRACRRGKVQIPILVVTARVAISDKVVGLDCGADDYLAKPFHFSEMLARIRALSRRPPQLRPSRVTVGRLTIELPSGQAFVNGNPIEITPIERRLLALLVKRPGSVVAKTAIYNQVYDLGKDASPNAIEKIVSRLRRSLATPGVGVDVRTVRGIGYALQERP